MVTERELLQAIEDCKKDPITYNSIEKLANLYVVYDHLFGNTTGYSAAPTKLEEVETIISKHGDSEFLQSVDGMSADKVWRVIDELLEVIKVTNTRLYESVLRKLQE